jgi:hypothetical protein
VLCHVGFGQGDTFNLLWCANIEAGALIVIPASGMRSQGFQP